MARKTLWGFYDGEPFMENPQLGILGGMNPRKGKKKMAVRRKRRSNARRRGRKHSAPRVHRRRNYGTKRGAARRRRGRRQNWLTSGMVVPPNPRRRRRSRMANPRRRKGHRRHHRNPKHLFGLTIPPIKTVAFGAVGFVGPSFISGFLNSTFPSVMQSVTSWGIAGKYVVKVASIGALAWLTKRFVGGGEAMAVTIGGGMNVAISLVNDFAPGILPANPLAMYLPTRPGMQAYVPVRSNLRGMRGTNWNQYQLQAAASPQGVAAGVRQIPTAALAPWALTDATQYGKFGGTATRLFRY